MLCVHIADAVLAYHPPIALGKCDIGDKTAEIYGFKALHHVADEIRAFHMVH
ncbi:hypothetical protein SAR116_2001 [Candidatus Puniceispirillum marinum IMCC1322]|uniref:Uncharacterized protein n=1 Tax=Puniceispirillum marinum (strain IMCC1322) TaxID=488538 RepID=D5BN51_PUNMI|nr:hypothetical protein SAR116_2001 [Candidatus Puniceispirillum marinum IMCC1322]